eukprot:CAMPEP_0182878766 /NCGR_PEP_ID=MMETSP0034_2-20130328/15557_1 /TAXON_ID=156128 /ORGANISM="Nephroselmis pyriformis, Strain CCMP717" /LENGTH=235 /DNA_ID=CAMNT_0025011663 /DNA_START=68 /DNA_END=772 /DNA_ORIENTATION=+
MAEEEETVRLERLEGGVALVTLNRPRAYNAFTAAMFHRLAGIFRQLREEEGGGACRVAVLTGEGKAFSAGVDLTAAGDVFTSDGDDLENDVVHQMELCPFPIIGAVNGHAVTAGFEVSLACDILLASTAAVFIDTHCKFGIMPSWGLSQKLPRLVGANRAREASLSAMPIDAPTALSWGLVSRVVEPAALLPDALALATRIASLHQPVVRGYKQVINEGLGMTGAEGRTMERARA